ncbi:MAG: hypothetical protein KAR79_04305 [Simkaniaceae bacterium]|nr:hypothetical protein [Simkaniaceae bacterium]
MRKKNFFQKGAEVETAELIRVSLNTPIGNMQIIQFMSIHKIPLMRRLLIQAMEQKSLIILDLEDTLRGQSKHATKIMKKWGRSQLLEFAHAYPKIFTNKSVGIRVNALHSDEIQNDLEILSELSSIWDIECVVGTKVQSNFDIDIYLSLLQRRKIQYKTFIPIVETVIGMTNLSLIAKHSQVKSMIYGHYDYSLDARHWPFFTQESSEFWKIATPFIKQIEKENVCYIHPPIASFSNVTLSKQVLKLLQKSCTLDFGMMTINTAQTTLLNRLGKVELETKERPMLSISYTLQEKIDKAKFIKKLCSTKKRLFGIDLKTGTFFSPHEYAAAVDFLESYGK